jgi:rhodanese-related sulfurtransferase
LDECLGLSQDSDGNPGHGSLNWTLVIVGGAALVAIYVVRRMSLVPVGAARKHLVAGALVVDVRTPEEFQRGHVLNAVNIPLPELEESAPRRLEDKSRVLLVHCLAGVRSAAAKRQLKGMGYSHVFNLGSLGRANRIVAGASNKG